MPQGFPQAPLDGPVFMQTPQNWNVDEMDGTLKQHAGPTNYLTHKDNQPLSFPLTAGCLLIVYTDDYIIFC
jgi:hypothetical protein